MDQTSAPLQIFNSAEPIPGYVIKERIGTGGYGEVWKTDAPGGLTKAIKFVYGHLNDVRASRELKSLNQIKEVRHPFLLSLERIEVIDGHLIIVTELAEQSLKEHFDSCRELGLPGIPRDELLSYLRDAADALDYIYEHYSLQHLDVKPENLLLLGGRIKVADFGLLKNLHDGSASLMGGLTPLYSPPELFDGRPNRYSDQYSLAVVFQEMLTGSPPFAGRTAAQLAAQHLHSRPTLASLPLADQRVVGRALSKDPNKRFETCRELVDALLDPSRSNKGKGITGSTAPVNSKRPSAPPVARPAKRSARDENASPNPPTKTELLDDNFFDGAALDAITGIHDAVPAVVTSLPPIELTGKNVRFRPTVFLGIGGTGARTLRRLRRRLHDQFGDLDNVPALQMLLVDTNLKAISDATRGERGVALTDRETIGLPLRRAEDYRADSKKLLSWMSRRWIYNIPRSLQTEGLRPLGRLAFVDRASYVMDRIREAIVTATDTASVAATSAATKLSFSPGAARVFVIASISGGTGSGMVLDVAYAVRQVLAELGLSDEDVCGILSHATDRKASTRDLAIANAYACLTELRHYSDRNNSYPGDAACGLPPFEANDFTFPNAYLVHLGDELNEEEFDAATDGLAEYLFLNVATPAGGFFDKCRELEHLDIETESRPATLRTFGLSQIGGCNSDIPSRAAEVLCKTLVHRWRGDVNAELGIRPPKLSEPGTLVEVRGAAKLVIDPDIERLAAEQARSLQLNVDHLIQMVYEVVEREMGSNAETYFSNITEESLARLDSRPSDDRNRPATVQILDTIDAILGLQGDESDEELPFQSLHDVLDRTIAEPARELGTAIREWILDLVDTSSARISGAQHASKWFTDHLGALEKSALERIQQQVGELAALKATLADPKTSEAASRKLRSSKRGAVDPRLLQYFKLRLREVVLRGVTKMTRSIQGQVTAGSDQLRDLWRDLNRLAEQFHVPSSLEQAGAEKNAGAPGDLWSSLFETLWSRKTELVTELDQALEAELFSTKGRLRRLLTEGVDVRGTLTVALRAAARTIVLRAMKQINVANMVDLSDEGSASESGSLGTRLESATPKLLRCGGAKRLLLVAPEGTDQARLQQEIRGETDDVPTVVADSGGDVVLCYEAEQVPIDKVASMLAEHREDYAKIASRLHTRIDVDWST